MPASDQNHEPHKLPPELPSELAETQAVSDLAERVGEFIEYWGFKSIHGKLWCHLYLSNKPLDSLELIRRLGVSKALVSISIHDLLDYQVIQKVGQSPQRTQLYRANPDVLGVIAGVLRQRERQMLERVRASYRTLARLTSEQREMLGLDSGKLRSLGLLILTAERALEALIALPSSLSKVDSSGRRRVRELLPMFEAAGEVFGGAYAPAKAMLTASATLLRKARRAGFLEPRS